MRISARSVGKLLPSGMKQLLLTSGIYNRFAAKTLASTSKKIDLCSAQIAHAFHLSDLGGTNPVRGKICLEIGSGWVLSHALILYLLGAKRVLAVDIEPIAYPSFLYCSIHKSNISVIRDILSPFEDHAEIRQRLDNLVKIRKFDLGILEDLGIQYIAPIDLSKTPLDITYDFCFSNSVLEHVPKKAVVPLLKNLASKLSLHGKMIHRIHLEDHKSCENSPFDFLCEPDGTFTADIESVRGNRIRKNEWCDLFSSIDCLDFKIIYEWSRNDKCLPNKIDASIKFADLNDLRCTHLGVYGEKVK
jgi:hypothetical protein